MTNAKDFLFRFNPWWNKRDYILNDEKVRKFSESKIKWQTELEIKEKNIYVLRGPRQVGKSTFLKSQIKNLLIGANVSQKSICYIPCDLIADAKELHEILIEYLAISKVENISRKWIFIDEVSFVENWPLALKSLFDSGELNETSTLVTGSNSRDLKRGAERLPGRGIEGNEYFFYPLPFNKYSKLFKHEKTIEIDLFELFTTKRHVSIGKFNELEKNHPSIISLNSLFQKFLKTGGFLKSINELESGKELEFETYLRWIEKDVLHFSRSLKYVQEILKSIISKNASPTSILGIAKQTDIGANVTVSEYLEILEEMEVLTPLYFFDRSLKQQVFAKEKKFHFLDPFISKAIEKWCNKELQEGALIEGIAAEHLRRLAKQNNYRIGYYKDKKNEVDITVEKNGFVLPIEVKWQEKISSSDFGGLYKFGFGIMLTKNELRIHKDNYMLIPLPLFLACLDIKTLQKLKYY